MNLKCLLNISSVLSLSWTGSEWSRALISRISSITRVVVEVFLGSPRSGIFAVICLDHKGGCGQDRGVRWDEIPLKATEPYAITMCDF